MQVKFRYRNWDQDDSSVIFIFTIIGYQLPCNDTKRMLVYCPDSNIQECELMNECELLKKTLLEDQQACQYQCNRNDFHDGVFIFVSDPNEVSLCEILIT